jgi:hypothetical protein
MLNAIESLQDVRLSITMDRKMMPDPRRIGFSVKATVQPDEILRLIEKRSRLRSTIVQLYNTQTDKSLFNKFAYILDKKSLRQCNVPVYILNEVMTDLHTSILLSNRQKETLVMMGAKYNKQSYERKLAAKFIAERALFLSIMLGTDIASIIAAYLVGLVFFCHKKNRPNVIRITSAQ